MFRSKDKFQEIFERQADIAVAAGGQLVLSFSGANPEEARRLVNNYEGMGDELLRQGYKLLLQAFITKLDKSDIEAIIKGLDDILDEMQSVALRLQAYGVSAPLAQGVEIAAIIEQMAVKLKEMVRALPKLSSDRVSEILNELKELEWRADDLRWKSVGELTADVKKAIDRGDSLAAVVATDRRFIWEQVIAKLERTTNLCCNLAVTLAGVVRKEGR